MDKIVYEDGRGEIEIVKVFGDTCPNIYIPGHAHDIMGTACSRKERGEKMQFVEIQLGNSIDTDWDEATCYRARALYCGSTNSGDFSFFIAPRGEDILLCEMYEDNHICTRAHRVWPSDAWYKKCQAALASN